MVVLSPSIFQPFPSNVQICLIAAEKNDVIDIIVTEISAGCIKGKVGHA